MNESFSVRTTLVLAAAILLAASSLSAQTVHLKDGRAVAAKALRRSGTTVMATIEVAGGRTGEVGYTVDKIAKIDFPEPPELKAAKDLIGEGKAEAASELLDPLLNYHAQFRDVPGTWWSQAALGKVSALQELQKDAEAEVLIGELSSHAADPDAAALARVRLGASMARKQQHEKAMEVYDKVIKESARPAILAEAWTAKANSLLALKHYDAALLAYLHIPVFYEDQRHLAPVALLGSARAFLGLEDRGRAKAALIDLTKNYPATSEATLAKAELIELDKQPPDPARPGC